MFTVEQRDAVRDRVLRLAGEDERVVAGAAVGSLALGGGDRFSDIDLTFAIADQVAIMDVLDDWTVRLAAELAAVRLLDLESGPSVYRVFVLPDALQLDLSMTPAREFRPTSPRFRLLFGETAGGETAARATLADDLFGWGVVYALHARACIERGRRWQAEHYIGALRDHSLSLACLRHGLPAVQARGHDDLPADELARYDATHVGSLEPDAQRAALGAAVASLLHECAQTDPAHADAVAKRLGDTF